MKATIFLLALSGMLFIVRPGGKSTGAACPAGNVSAQLPDSLELYDPARYRVIPVALYKPKRGIKPGTKLIIFSHGYSGGASPSPEREYRYLTESLASQGYLVASIRHELPTDSLMPTTGIPQVVRHPFWERGSNNILFVIHELAKRYPQIDSTHITLIGHSNGGDMTALFATSYPGLVDKIITLDNRRMALPHTRHPRIYSLRSSDQPADEGVLPTAEEIKKYNMQIVQLSHTRHNEMNDNGTEAQHSEINGYVVRFLNDR